MPQLTPGTTKEINKYFLKIHSKCSKQGSHLHFLYAPKGPSVPCLTSHPTAGLCTHFSLFPHLWSPMKMWIQSHPSLCSRIFPSSPSPSEWNANSPPLSTRSDPPSLFFSPHHSLPSGLLPVLQHCRHDDPASGPLHKLFLLPGPWLAHLLSNLDQTSPLREAWPGQPGSSWPQPPYLVSFSPFICFGSLVTLWTFTTSSFLKKILAISLGVWDLSSAARDWTHDPAVEERSLNLCTAREVLNAQNLFV